MSAIAICGGLLHAASSHCATTINKLPTQRNTVGLFDTVPQMSGKGLLCFVSYRQWKPTGTRWDRTSAAPEAIFFSSLSLQEWSCFVSILRRKVHAALSNPGCSSQNICLLRDGTTEHANKTIVGICSRTAWLSQWTAAASGRAARATADERSLMSEPQPAGLIL